MESGFVYDEPFRFNDPWQISPFTSGKDRHSIFEAFAPSLPPLQDFENDDSSHFAFQLELPESLEHEQSSSPVALGSDSEDTPETYLGPSIEDAEDDALSIWTSDLSLAAPVSRPELKTWETFEITDATLPTVPAYLSEAGPLAFDAAVSDHKTTAGVLPQDVALRSLCNLVLGRSSMFFQWDQTKMSFEAALGHVPASGLSPALYANFWSQLAAFGSSMIRLRNFAESGHYKGKSSPTMLAMQSSVSSIANAIEESISKQLSYVKSFLQLQHAVEAPHRLLRILRSLVESTKECQSEEHLLCLLSEFIQVEVGLNLEFAALLQHLLARVSLPWLERVCVQVGLCSAPSGSSNSATEVFSYAPLHQHMEDMEIIRRATNSLKTLKNASPDHALLHLPDKMSKDLRHLLQPVIDSGEFQKTANEYKEAALRLVCGPENTDEKTVQAPSLQNFKSLCEPPSIDMSDDQHSNDQWSFEIGPVALQSSQGENISPVDHFQGHVIKSLQGQEAAETVESLPQDSMLIEFPLNRMRPLIQMQARLLDGVVLRHIFKDACFRQHLELHRSYHLFGNGEFVTRLSDALFSQDAQPAERTRETMPTAGLIGLRLGASQEQRWPPASSELQLSLMGILTDVYKPPNKSRAASTQNILPGGLSFSIRELPESEIERTLDASSIFALDFLRLQYQAPAPLDKIFTSDSLQQYDSIFRWLLRLLRLIHVTSNLQRTMSNRVCNEWKAFAFLARHIVSTLATHYTDVGIEAPWRDLMAAVDSISQKLADEDTEREIGTRLTAGLDDIHKFHIICLDRMRRRLFLRSKQHKIRAALEHTMTAVLTGCNIFSMLSSRDDSTDQAALHALRTATDGLCSLLEEQASKPPKSIATADGEDPDTAKLLLQRLRWNQAHSLLD